MTRASLMALAALGTAACHATSSLEPPPAEGRSTLMIATGEAGYRIAFAVDIPDDGSPPRYPTFTRPAEIDLYAVNFSCPLEILGLEPGRQVLTSEPTDRLELPVPRSIFASHDGAEQTPWEEVDLDRVEEILRSVEVPEDNLCRLYGVRLAPPKQGFRVGTSTPTVVVPLTEETALVGNADGSFFEVDIEENVRPLDHISPDTPRRAGFAREDGEVVLVGRDGTVARGYPLESDFTIVHTGGATVADFLQVDGSKAGPLEIFRTSWFGFEHRLLSQGPLEHFDGQDWEQITDGNASFSQGSYSVAWIGPGRAIASGVVDEPKLVRYEDGELTLEELPNGAVAERIVDLPGIGVVIGTRRGRIVRRVDDAWRLDEASDLSGGARAIVRTERGFFYGETRWGSWDPVGGYCALDVQTNSASRIVRLGSRGFLAHNVFPDEAALFTLERTDADLPCLAE